MLAYDMLPTDPSAKCHVCQRDVDVEPSEYGDAICPYCGTTVWVPPKQGSRSFRVIDRYELTDRATPLKPRFRALGDDGLEVEVRFLHPSLCHDQSIIERWLREADVVSKMDHPNILKVLDFGKHEGVYYMVSEFVDGPSVAQMLETQGRLKLQNAVRIVRCCCEALACVHEQEILHRGICPDNMLIGSNNVVRLRDFGDMKPELYDTAMSASGNDVTAALIAPPEQTRHSQDVGRRADIYALGMCFYHFLTGQIPFRADSVVKLIIAKEKGLTTPIQHYEPAVPVVIADLIHCMIDPNPNGRPESCQRVIAELDCYSADETPKSV